MLNELQQFLMDNPITALEEEVIVSERLKNFPFKIKCINAEQLSEYQKQCIKNPNSPKKRQFDVKKFNELIIINHCIYPNFKDTEWLNSSGCATNPGELVNRTLAAGEIVNLSEQIQKLSGFGEEEQQEEIEEIKNC